MREKVNKTILEDLKNKEKNRNIEISLNDGLLDISIGGEKYKGLTAKEVAEKFGQNYYIVQTLRFLFEGEEIEQTIQEAQSVKKEVIDMFIKILQQKNIFEGLMSIEEIRERLEQNIDAVYVSDDSYWGAAGVYEAATKNLYITLNGKNLEKVKKMILSGNIEELSKFNIMGLICHEIIHALSSKGAVSGFNDPYDRGLISINEGLTEILAKEMLPDSAEAYFKEVETTKYLLAILGKEEIIKAYLNADRKSLIRMVEEKGVSAEFWEFIDLADDRARNFRSGIMKSKETDSLINSKIVDLINSIGSIDISKFEEQNITIPNGINSEIITKAINEAFLKDEKIGETAFYKQLVEKYPIVGVEIIDLKNNRKIDFEEYVKQGLVENNEHIIVQRFLEKGKDFKDFCMDVKCSMGTMEEKYEKKLLTIVGALLSMGADRLINNPEISEFKRDVIEEIIYGDFGRDTNTEGEENFSWYGIYTMTKGEEDFSWEEKISRIDKWEYYTTDEGNFLVDLENGEMIGRYKDSEIINIEEAEKSEKGIKYTSEEKGTRIFFTEKDNNGKFVLKGYVIDEKGHRVELDVGLGRDFLDDTTELDRQIVLQTSEVRSGSIKAVAESIKREMSIETEKTIENKEDNGER